MVVLSPQLWFWCLDMIELFLWYGCTKGPVFFQQGPLSHILTITNAWYGTNQIWTCAEPLFRLLQWSCTRRSRVGISNFSLHIESGFICQQKKLFWISSFRNLVKDWVFLAFTGPKRVLEIILAWWVLVHKTEYSFQYIFWIINHLVMKLGQYRDIAMGNIFGNYFS